ncbi:MAG: cupin domain-containing protein [Gammaproteobacteria bacterium]|nr:cupin domain-containing protein [Gammaproteobacteria bacterium]MCP5135552.1 cupin domain-containing protein [Gammaproteobacteria bacterium]
MNTFQAPTLRGDIDTASFVRETWQLRPRLFRQAFQGFCLPLSLDEVAGLACESQIESRLILEKDGATPWAVQHGPFDETVFAKLPASHWTLLVQDVDKWVPEAAAFLDTFRFLPDWRVDDLMISIAADQGSVGPHWDDYDVFLIQGAGRREWRIDERPVAPDNCLDGTDLRIMRDFQTTQSWVLEPGDMLYLPPRLAHHGIALGDGCMTLSVGFRAPDQAELIEDFVADQLASLSANPRFRDPHRVGGANPGMIDAGSIDTFRTLIQSGLTRNADQFAEWLGRFLTRAKPGIGPLPRDDATLIVSRDLPVILLQGRVWIRDGASRFALIPAGVGETTHRYGFVNGQALVLDAAQFALFDFLCLHTRYTAASLTALSQTPTTRSLLTQLINEGHLYALD